ANPDTAVHVRARTTVPQQSLAAINAPLVVAAARTAAARLTGDDDGARIEALWRCVLSRSPSTEERTEAAAWLAAEAEIDDTAETPPEFTRWARLAQALMATSEFQFID
ncbi:MAG: DUF1553 domain-containing protein, partial [Planctomycetia bacterium]